MNVIVTAVYNPSIWLAHVARLVEVDGIACGNGCDCRRGG